MLCQSCGFPEWLCGGCTRDFEASWPDWVGRVVRERLLLEADTNYLRTHWRELASAPARYPRDDVKRIHPHRRVTRGN